MTTRGTKTMNSSQATTLSYRLSIKCALPRGDSTTVAPTELSFQSGPSTSRHPQFPHGFISVGAVCQRLVRYFFVLVERVVLFVLRLKTSVQPPLPWLPRPPDSRTWPRISISNRFKTPATNCQANWSKSSLRPLRLVSRLKGVLGEDICESTLFW